MEPSKIFPKVFFISPHHKEVIVVVLFTFFSCLSLQGKAYNFMQIHNIIAKLFSTNLNQSITLDKNLLFQMIFINFEIIYFSFF